MVETMRAANTGTKTEIKRDKGAREVKSIKRKNIHVKNCIRKPIGAN